MHVLYAINFFLFVLFLLTAVLSLIVTVLYFFDKTLGRYLKLLLRSSLCLFVAMLALCLVLLFLYLKVIPKPLELRPFPEVVAQAVNVCVPFVALQTILTLIVFRELGSVSKWLQIGVATITIVGFVAAFIFIRTQLIPEVTCDFVWWF